MVSSNYNCTQADLYKACRQIWLMCQEHLTEFAKYKGCYTTVFVDENLALINTVAAMENYENRQAPVKDRRKDLMAAAVDCSDLFKLLKGYCTTAFKDDTVVRDAMIGEAGQQYFDKISTGNWSQVSGLLSAMVPFVKKRKETLMEKAYMPEGFIARLEEQKVVFEAALSAWESQKENATPNTEAKIIANNDLKNRVMEVLADGQMVFIKNKAMAQKFVWNSILTEVRGTKPAGLAGRVTDAATKKGLANVVVAIEALGLTVTTDAEGRYEFASLAEGIYEVTFTIEGFKKQIVEKREVKANIKRRLNMAMDNI